MQKLLFSIFLFYFSILNAATCNYQYDSTSNNNINNSYPGVTINELNHITTDATYTTCGSSANNDKDYYSFTVNTEGNLTITTSSPNNHKNHFEIWVNDSVYYSYDTGKNRVINVPLRTNSTIVFLFKETGNDTDQYQAILDFKAGSIGSLIPGDRPFSVRNPADTRNISGNYAIIGNTNQCALHSTNTNPPWQGECYQSYSNSRPSRYIDIDNNTSTKNSSSSSLSINNFTAHHAKVLWAGLYWQGVIHNSNKNGDFMGDSGLSNGITISNEPVFQSTQINFSQSSSIFDADKVQFKTPTQSYIEVQADVIDFYKLGYSAFKDVTDLLNQNDPNGIYTVADIKSNQGVESHHGNYASWALVIIYEDSYEKYRNITLFDGYATVDSSFDQDLIIRGFLTPRTPPINSKLALFAMDGDNGTNSLTIVNQAGEATNVQNQDYPNHSLFDSTISNSINRDPDNTSLRTDLKVLNLTDVLNPLETEATLKPRSGGDRYTPSFFIISADLYVPKFCYDYSYKQQGVYFTEKNDGTQQPRIVGNVIKDEPIEVKIYLRNQVESDIDVSDMNVSVLDINTSQAKYIYQTTYLANDGDLIASHIDDSNLNVSDSYIKNVQIGKVSSNDFFYLYYNLNPIKNDLNISLHVRADYLLSVDGGDPIPYSLTLGNNPENIRMCSDTNFRYLPAKGIFNIVHNNYYTWNGHSGSKYYNLPTQISSRVGNFKILSMDPEDLDKLKGASTMVAVDMIDASAFHDTNASCAELSSSISPRIWVHFENNATSKSFDNTIVNTDFYKNARQNAAFRVAYNVDNNDSYIETEQLSPGRWKLKNFTAVAGDECSGDFVPTTGNSHQIVTYCGNNGVGQGNNGMTEAELKECMECIFGLKTKVICSRDNFAIRPEAFMIHIKDQNQSNPVQQSSITTLNDSGGSSAMTPELHLAAGYQYNIEVNATNHINNTSTPGYTRSFNIDNTALSTYKWAPQTGHDVSGCNAPTDVNTSMRFLDGSVDTNTSLDNVGHYTLMLKDSSWTLVDHDPNFMTHHTGSYFYASSVADCRTNADITLTTNASMSPNTSNNDNAILNGCNIASLHTNSEATIQYNDYNVTFHPYKFTLFINPTVDVDRSTSLTLNSTSYIYYADITQASDENMSYHLDSLISAQGENGVTLSNFVDACYAVPLDLEITTLNSRDLNDTNGNHVNYIARFHDLNSSGDIQNALDINTTDSSPSTPFIITTTSAHFLPTLNGNMSSQLNLNYSRAKNIAINPSEIKFLTYTTKCTNASGDCTFDANLTSMSTEGSQDLNTTIRHYYGRTHNPRQSFDKNASTTYTDATDLIYYEVYCDGIGCDKSLLQDGATSQFSDDPRWLINTHHTTAFGLPGHANQKGYSVGNGYVKEITPATGNHPDAFGIRYDGTRGYPYKTTMENNASGWLIYNRYNPAATKNSWDVEFINASGNWAGVRETNTTTKRNASDKTNRRTLW